MGLFDFLKKKDKDKLPPVPEAMKGDVPPPPPSLDEEEKTTLKPQAKEEEPLPDLDEDFPPLPEWEEPEESTVQTKQVAPRMKDDFDFPSKKEGGPLPQMDLPEFPEVPEEEPIAEVDEVPEDLPDLEEKRPVPSFEASAPETEQEDVPKEEPAEEAPEEETYEEPLEAPEPIVTEEGPLYLKLSHFHRVVGTIDDASSTLSTTEEHVDQLHDIHEKLRKEEEKWRKSVDQLQKKLLYLDGMLFEG